MKSIAGLLTIYFFVIITASAQNDDTWNGKKCAVVLTYDDGLNVHLNNAIPALDAAGLKATFYISDYFNGLKDQVFRWRAAAENGHELANHTIWHPCEGGRPGREFVRADYDLNNYTVRRMGDEILTMNNLLKAIDGKALRTFAYPCGDIKLNDTAYLNPVKNEFIAARGVRSGMLRIDSVDLYNIGCYTIAGQSKEQLVELVRQAMKSHTLLVFLFHGVGGEHSLNVSLEAHSGLLNFLNENRNDIWIAPLIDVAQFVKSKQ